MNLDKCLGCILMIGVGDACGVPFETMTAEEIEYLELIGYVLDDYFCPSINPHPFPDILEKSKGSWSDDTQLTLVTLESIIEARGVFNMDVCAKKHIEAYQSRARRGWGRSTRQACKRLQEGIHWTKSGETDGSGNGVMMKIAPLALLEVIKNKNRLFYLFLRDCIDYARMTHGNPSAIVAGYIHAYALSILLCCQDRLLPPDFLDQLFEMASFTENYFYFTNDTTRITTQIRMLKKMQADGSLFLLNSQSISRLFGGEMKEAFSASNSFGTAYTAFLRHPNSFECIFDCIRMGGDTDSNAAIAGSLLGALSGRSIIPQKFIDNLEEHEHIEERVKVFYGLCSRSN